MRIRLAAVAVFLGVCGEAMAQPFGPFGEAGDILGCILGESFDTHPAYTMLPIDPKDDYSYITLADGGNISGQLGYGVVDNSSAISSPTYNGPVGGPDPTGERGGMLHVQRASLGEAPLVDDFEVKYRFAPGGWYFATPERPLFVTLDFYKNTHGEFQLLSHFGNINPLRLFAGGYYFDSNSADLAGLRGEPNVLEGAVMVGLIDETQGALYRGGRIFRSRSGTRLDFYSRLMRARRA